MAAQRIIAGRSTVFQIKEKSFFEITAKEIYYGASGKNWCIQDKDKQIWSHLAPLGLLIMQSYSLELHHKTCTQDSYTSVSSEFSPGFLWSTSIGYFFIPKFFTLLSQVVWKLLLVLLTILAETYNDEIVIFLTTPRRQFQQFFRGNDCKQT